MDCFSMAKHGAIICQVCQTFSLKFGRKIWCKKFPAPNFSIKFTSTYNLYCLNMCVCVCVSMDADCTSDNHISESNNHVSVLTCMHVLFNSHAINVSS